MSLYLINEGKMLVRFLADPTETLFYPAIPGSTAYVHNDPGKDLKLLLKELITDLFTIRYKSFHFPVTQTIEAISGEKGLHTRVMLKSGIEISIEKLGVINQQQDSVTMVWSERSRCTVQMDANVEYRALDIYFRPELVNQLAAFLPELGGDFQDVTIRQVFPEPCPVSARVRKIITEILECPYDEPTSRFYFDLKVREYLFLLLEECRPVEIRGHRFTSFETSQIYRVRELLVSDLATPPPSLRVLAREVGINEFKLKAGFKHYFKMSAFEYLQAERMVRAEELLLTTNEPIKSIAKLTGFSSISSFIKSFRTHFGYTPGSLRRK